MRAGTGAAQSHHQQKGEDYQSEGDHRFHRLSVSKRSAYGTTVTLVNVALFSVLELPDATARPT
jgi:hypothetical protein